MSLADYRMNYHQAICEQLIRITQRGATIYPNFADSGSRSSVAIASRIVELLGYEIGTTPLQSQSIGAQFEAITRDFVRATLALLAHLRPGDWVYDTQAGIAGFDQYEHLDALERMAHDNPELASALGTGYIIKPDIVIGRQPVSDVKINQANVIVHPDESAATHTPLRKTNSSHPRPILHASISCKWTIRSDRSQNTRTEALNLIRNRKGNTPHIVAVIAEPLPTRIASLALGTGDLDCVYHVALPELQQAAHDTSNEDQIDMLHMLVEGRRLRDISDLPLDLAI